MLNSEAVVSQQPETTCKQTGEHVFHSAAHKTGCQPTWPQFAYLIQTHYPLQWPSMLHHRGHSPVITSSQNCQQAQGLGAHRCLLEQAWRW